jgi:hypothetical protein
MIKKVYEIKDLLNEYEVKNTYKTLLDHNWAIDTAYSPSIGIMYPTFRVSFNKQIFNPYWFGYFSGLVVGVNNSLRKNHKFGLGDYEIKAITLNAQQHNSKFHFHDHRDFKYTIVGFLTPEWEDDWGGHLQIEDTSIQFSPGNFVLFSGSDLHDAMPVKVKLPFWRISVGIMID